MSISKVIIASDTVGGFANKYNDLCDEVSALSSPVTPFTEWTGSTGLHSIKMTNGSGSAVGDYAISAGFLGQASGSRSTILGGFNNNINGGAQNSSIIGTNVGVIRTGATNSAIIGGGSVIIDSSLTNVAVIASNNVLAAYSNSVYTPALRINSDYGINFDSGSTASPCFSSTTLVSGTKTITTAAARPTSLIFLTVQTPGGTQGFLSVDKAVGSFDINSTSATETSVVSWMIINPF